MGQQFEMRLNVNSSDLDDLNHVNNVVYLKWVQDVAANHWKVIAPQGFDAHSMWVVLKHVIEYKKPALLGDEILIRTWVETIEGVRSDRRVDVFNAETGVLLCTARTTWCLIDRESQRPRRIDGEIKSSLMK